MNLIDSTEYKENIKNHKEIEKKDIQSAIQILKEKKLVKTDDMLIVLHGEFWTQQGATSTVRILKVE